MTFGIDEWMVAWAPSDGVARLDGDAPAGSVKVGPWPDTTQWSDGYEMTTGCCNGEWHHLTLEGKVARMLEHMAEVVADGVHPVATHAAFLAIEEYRRRHEASPH